MASEKSKTAIIIAVIALVVIIVAGGIGFVVVKLRTQAAQRREVEELKERNPVEYFILRTPLTQSEDELRQGLAGTWHLAGAKSVKTGEFVRLDIPQNYRKTFTLTNWAVVAYDNDSNVLYTASGRYTLQGENITESIEAATGAKKQFLGSHPTFRIRLDGDNFYEMGKGDNPSVEQMWVRAGQ